MKIDFNLRFQELSRLLESPSSTGEGAKRAEFGTLLGDIDRRDLSNNLSTIPSTTPATAPGQIAERLFPPPMLHNPDPASPLVPGEPISTESERKEGVGALTPKGEGVATVPPVSASPEAPHVLSVRRISAQELAGLDHTERKAVVRELVTDAGRRHGIDPALSLAVASAESSFNPLAVSSDGAESKGLFQLLDTTGLELHDQLGAPRAYDPFNPSLNVDLGVGYLRRLHDLFTTTTTLTNNQSTVPAANSSSLEKLAVAAFNAGEGRVAAAQQRAARAGRDPAEYLDVEPYLPESTRQYVARVIRMRDEFEGSAMG